MASLCLVLLGGCGFLLMQRHLPQHWLWLMAAAWVIFGLGTWLVLRSPRRWAVWLILLGAVGLPLAAGFAPPRTSDDLYRYVWDGRVQAAGIDPYAYVPAAPELVGLRDDFLWPRQSAWCVPDGCTLINRPTVNTIYPPVAQAYFVTVHSLSPEGAEELPIQLASTLFVIATTIVLLVALPDPRWAVIWAWCPLVAWEAGNNAHVDVVAVFLAALALVAMARKHVVASGVFLGLAIGVKFLPALLGPSMLRRKPLAVILGSAATMAVAYLPHVVAVGPAAIGFLPAYLGAEGYTNGERFALLTAILPMEWATVAALVILGVTTILVYLGSDPDRPWDSATVMVGVALLVASSGYSWYSMLLVMLIAFSRRLEWLAVPVAGYLAQFALGPQPPLFGYACAATFIAVAGLWRSRSYLRRRAHAL